MVKNLRVNSPAEVEISKISVHNLIYLLKEELNFEIYSLEINFVGSEIITQINRKFLKHNYSTDIITFNYSNKRLTFDSEIYISLEDAEKNSKRYKVSLGEEIVRLVIHGILHLLDYDDTREPARGLMKREENRLVTKYRHASQNIIKV